MNKTYIIGITGTFGKTSCARMLTTYLRTLNYSVNLVSSNCVDLTDNTASFDHNALTQEQIEYIYRISNQVDFLIIEAHEDGILQDFYKNIPFDCRVLTSFKSDFNMHRTKELYLQLKTSFINSGDCLRVLNKEADHFTSFSQDNSYIFSTNPNDTDCSIFPVQYNNTVENSSVLVQLEQEQILISTQAQKTQYKNIITVMSVLQALDLLDIEYFVDNFLPLNLQVSGRNQRVNIGNRICIIDSGNGRAVEEFMTTNTDTDKYHVKAILNVIGGLNDTTYKQLTSNSNFITLNKFDVRPPALAFGGNLYLALNNLKEFPDFDPCFERIIQKTGGKQYFCDYTNIHIDFPEHLVDDIIAFTDLNHWEEPSDTLWWRSSLIIKAYFTIHFQDFLYLYDQLVLLNNSDLTQHLDQLKTILEYNIAAMSQLGTTMSQYNVDKYYLTFNTNNTANWSNIIELELHKAFFTKPVEIYLSRQDALKAIYKESSEKDVLIITGRGDSKSYYNGEKFINFTDLEYLQSLEVQENE